MSSDQEATLSSLPAGSPNNKSSVSIPGAGGADVVASPPPSHHRKTHSSSSGMSTSAPQTLLSPPHPTSPLLTTTPTPRQKPPLITRPSFSGSVDKGPRLLIIQDDHSSMSEDADTSLDSLEPSVGLDEKSVLGTGPGMANSKRNADFHAIFKDLPETEQLVEGELFLVRCLVPPSQTWS